MDTYEKRVYICVYINALQHLFHLSRVSFDWVTIMNYSWNNIFFKRNSLFFTFFQLFFFFMLFPLTYQQGPHVYFFLNQWWIQPENRNVTAVICMFFSIPAADSNFNSWPNSIQIRYKETLRMLTNAQSVNATTHSSPLVFVSMLCYRNYSLKFDILCDDYVTSILN